MNNNCPSSNHFHVTASDVFEADNRFEIIECSDPNEALHQVILELPASWEGSIEVSDDKRLGPDAMPLIDFWRTPSGQS